MRRWFRLVRNLIQIIIMRLWRVDYTSDVKFGDISRDISVGKYSYIGTGCIICPNVSIGNYVMLSTNVAIVGRDHNFDLYGTPIVFSGRPKPRVTVIGSDVWIGHGATIMEGVTIGDGSIVSAGSVVTKDVEPFSIVAGVPAKKIRMRFDREEYEEHLDVIKNAKLEGMPPKRIYGAKD